jgi:hypothetical protein
LLEVPITLFAQLSGGRLTKPGTLMLALQDERKVYYGFPDAANTKNTTKAFVGDHDKIKL